MKVIVTGGRNYADSERIDAELTHVAPLVVIHGDCNRHEFDKTGVARGADMLAHEWALGHQVSVVAYPADWNKYGRAAGPKRNEKMCRENQDAVLLAFPGGKGTNDCVRQASALGMRVIEVKP